jgi:hypothetical protein
MNDLVRYRHLPALGISLAAPTAGRMGLWWEQVPGTYSGQFAGPDYSDHPQHFSMRWLLL